MAEFKYEIVKELGVISENAKGWRKELNLVSWNEREPKYDIREWSPDHERMGKGVSLTEEEILALAELIAARDEEDDFE
ncbi:MAG: hypothetical protein J1F60_05515 [Oscillospiraceae bacterium]|nr:hypothetical protein [Oscillospiraceae bacterium]